MAERRMFSKQVVGSDAFLDMPQTTQNLYFHLGMNADDEGFISSPKQTLRMIGANANDLDILLAKKYIVGFESGIVVVKHWKLNNSMRKDRIKLTVYSEEKMQLAEKENGVYTLNSIDYQQCQPIVNQLSTNCPPSIGEVRVGEVSVVEGPKTKKFIKPTIKEIENYCIEKKYAIDAEYFFNHYETNGWIVGRNGTKMKNWKSAVSNWNKNNNKFNNPNQKIESNIKSVSQAKQEEAVTPETQAFASLWSE